MSAATMAVDGTSLRVLSVAGAQSRLVELLGDERPGAGWWVAITRALDDLADAVHTTPGDLLDPEGFTEQLRSDAPHLMGRWQRMAADRDHLTATITAVRLQAGRAAGNPDAVGPVSAAIRTLLTQVRRYQERTTDVLLDAYQRDLGGDSPTPHRAVRARAARDRGGRSPTGGGWDAGGARRPGSDGPGGGCVRALEGRQVGR